MGNKQNYERSIKMDIKKNANGSALEVCVIGRLDTTTAPQLEVELKESLEGVDNLTLNFAELEYISSAGLRVVLASQKTMNKQGSMIVKNVSGDIREVLDVTGFSDILTIE